LLPEFESGKEDPTLLEIRSALDQRRDVVTDTETLQKFVYWIIWVNGLQNGSARSGGVAY
jgi:hypothetical protein